MQELLSKNNKNLLCFFAVSELIDELITSKARHLYTELIKISLDKQNDCFLINKNFLKKRLKFKTYSLKKAFLELENQKLISKDVSNKPHSLLVKLKINLFDYFSSGRFYHQDASETNDNQYLNN